MDKRFLKRVARNYAYNLLRLLDNGGFADGSNLTEDEKNYINEEVQKLGRAKCEVYEEGIEQIINSLKVIDPQKEDAK